ncbi:hypothetical protein N0V84_005999 [Fusarium piperis]|uniref:Helicase C-terminal domain-containing protein n=1 Tax=Fusarium piperis TaxID=1435070 RepID=A0A9W8WCR8_9HYPO|nr:hypothetical protein N0V84_005999 [Fusarium piperis]
MYRRTQNETFLGYKIVDLPNTHSQDLWVPLEDWEMAMMRALQNGYEKGQPAVEEHDEEQEDEGEPKDTDQVPGAAGEKEGDETEAQDDTVKPESAAGEEEDDEVKAQDDTDKPPSTNEGGWSRFIGLRQAVSHPLNLEKFLREKNREKDIRLATERLKEEAESIQNDADESNAHTEQMAQDKVGRERFSVGAHQIETLYKDWIGGAEEMAKLRTLAANEHEVRGVTCGFCKKKKPPVDPTRGANVRVNFDSVASTANEQQCKHIFCETCLIVGVSKGSRSVKIEFTCPVPGCSATLGVGESLITPACIKESLKNAKELKPFKEPGRDSIGTQWSGDRDGCTSFFLATCGREDIDYGPVKMPWGSKVKATMEVILTWVKEAPDDKIIVFVEFTRTAKALGCILEKMGIGFLYYNRMASSSQKDKALHEFRENPRQKILMASMKCGGQALDLPVANRVIIVDLWYNKTTEEQAFKRVHRLGQKKETHLVRILARGSIDERLYMLQNAKQAIVNRAMQDDGHLIEFSDGQSLRWLFSGENEEGMRQGLEAEVRRKKDKMKAKTKAKTKKKKA